MYREGLTGKFSLTGSSKLGSYWPFFTVFVKINDLMSLWEMTFNLKSFLPFSLRHISYQKTRNVNSSGLLISLSFVCSYHFYGSLDVKHQSAQVYALCFSSKEYSKSIAREYGFIWMVTPQFIRKPKSYNCHFIEFHPQTRKVELHT